MSQSTDSIFTSKKTAIVAGTSIVVAILFAVAGAHAYPGAKAQDLQSIQIKSYCHVPTDKTVDVQFYGYEDAGVRLSPDNTCPKAYSVVVASKSTQVGTAQEMNAAGKMGYSNFDYNTRQHFYWTTHYTVSIRSKNSILSYEIGEAAFDLESKIIQTARDATPVTYNANQAVRTIEPAKRDSSDEKIKVVRVVGTCAVKGKPGIFLQVRLTDDCESGAQFHVRTAPNKFGTQDRSNSVVEVRSKFGVSLFDSILLWAAAEKFNLDRLTASPKYPLLITLDLENKQVLKIEPTISPLTL